MFGLQHVHSTLKPGLCILIDGMRFFHLRGANMIFDLPIKTFPEVGDEGLVAEPLWCKKSVSDKDDAISWRFSSKLRKSRLLLLWGVTMATAAGGLFCGAVPELGDKGAPEGGIK